MALLHLAPQAGGIVRNIQMVENAALPQARDLANKRVAA
jgi:hypothetical protein